MKNTIICSIAVLSAALLAACTETTRIWPEEGESKAYVEVSSQKVIFDADGGNAVITALPPSASKITFWLDTST